MTHQFDNNTLKAKTDQGRWKALSLMALYFVLAVAVGAARSELHDFHPAKAGAETSQTARSAG